MKTQAKLIREHDGGASRRDVRITPARRARRRDKPNDHRAPKKPDFRQPGGPEKQRRKQDVKSSTG